MKFFSDLRSCYRSGVGTGVADTALMQRQESHSGVGSSGSPSRRKRTEMGGHWRPALSVISEDGDVIVRAAAAEAKTRDRGAKSVKRLSPPKDRSATKGARSFSDREDYRSNPLSMYMPAFSPTPFII